MRKRTISMALAISTVLMLASALPAGATECRTITFEHRDGSPFITSGNEDAGTTRAAITGHFLTVTIFGGPEQSVDVADSSIETAIVCDDGSIELVRAQPQAEQAPAPEVNASQDSPTPIYLVPRVQDVGPGDAA